MVRDDRSTANVDIACGSQVGRLYGGMWLQMGDAAEMLEN
jgi:hypothetical protein